MTSMYVLEYNYRTLSDTHVPLAQLKFFSNVIRLIIQFRHFILCSKNTHKVIPRGPWESTQL